MPRHIHDRTSLASFFPSLARTASANGTGVDVTAYDGEAVFVLDSALGTGTSPTLDVKLQDSPDNSIWTDIPGATFAQVTDAAAAQEKIKANITGASKWVRAVATIGGTTPSFTFSVHALIENKVAT